MSPICFSKTKMSYLDILLQTMVISDLSTSIVYKTEIKSITIHNKFLEELMTLTAIIQVVCS